MITDLRTSMRAHADAGAKIRIDTLEAMESTVGRRQLRFVLAWAALHQDELLENWRLPRAGETLREIAGDAGAQATRWNSPRFLVSQCARPPLRLFA